MGRMASVQHALFHELPRLPEGFWYQEKLLSTEEERALLPAQHTFSVVRPAGIGSTASHLLTGCAIPSPSGAYVSRENEQ